MSGPGRLNFATFAAKVPCPNSTMTTVSSSPALEASASSAFVTPSRVAAASASRVTCPFSIPSFAVAVSASVVPHFLNSSPCSGVPASPTTMSRCVLCANAAGATERQATSRMNSNPAFCLLPLPLPSAFCLVPHHASLHTLRSPHSAQTIPTSAISRMGMCHSSRSSTAVTPRPEYFRSSASDVILSEV